MIGLLMGRDRNRNSLAMNRSLSTTLVVLHVVLICFAIGTAGNVRAVAIHTLRFTFISVRSGALSWLVFFCALDAAVLMTATTGSMAPDLASSTRHRSSAAIVKGLPSDD